MSDLNAEQIKKALECCTRGRKNKDDRPCDDCPYNECNLVGGTSERQIKGTCQGWLMKDALALIKKLTLENSRLHASCTELTRKLEIANLDIECKERICESYMLQYGTVADKELWLKKERADTVRKMQERLKGAFNFGHTILEKSICDIIDQIAKEMLEGENEN